MSFLTQQRQPFTPGIVPPSQQGPVQQGRTPLNGGTRPAPQNPFATSFGERLLAGALGANRGGGQALIDRRNNQRLQQLQFQQQQQKAQEEARLAQIDRVSKASVQVTDTLLNATPDDREAILDFYRDNPPDGFPPDIFERFRGASDAVLQAQRDRGLTIQQRIEQRNNTRDFNADRADQQIANADTQADNVREDRLADNTIANTQSQIADRETDNKLGRDTLNQTIRRDTSAAEIAQRKLDSGTPVDFKDVTSLRKEFTKITDDFRSVGQQHDTLKSAARLKTSAGDLALIVAFTKLLDPGSVAREGEVTLSQSTASVVDNASVWAARLKKGRTLLPDNTRQQFLDAAQEIMSGYNASFDLRRDEFTGIADRANIDRRDVLIGASQREANRDDSPPPPPPSGFVVDGQ